MAPMSDTTARNIMLVGRSDVHVVKYCFNTSKFMVIAVKCQSTVSYL